MKRAIWAALNWLGYGLCELAFRADCWGPFAWAYRWGCAAYGAEFRLGLRWGFLALNPRFGERDQPQYIAVDNIAGRRA